LNRLVALASLCFAACVPSTTVEQTWTTPAARSQAPLQRVVTVFFSDSVTIRHAGEDRIARDLRARGVEATPSYAVLEDNELRDCNAVRSKLMKLGYDGVVTMRVVDQHQEVEYLPPTFDAYWGYAYPGFYSPGIYDPGYVYTETIVRVETSAYSLQTNQLVWSGLTRTVGDEVDHLINSTSRVIAKQLTRRGLAA
jgi:hypothetical protein